MNDQDTVLAIHEIKGTDNTIELHGDGYWHGDSPYKESANLLACWKEWSPQDGDPSIWACETVMELLPGKLTSFFVPDDMGDPLEKSAKTP